jgi:hypothetical protein
LGWCLLQHGTTAVPPKPINLPASDQKPILTCAPSCAELLQP